MVAAAGNLLVEVDRPARSWRAMACRLLAAHEQAPDHPRLYEPAATLAAGRLADPDQIIALDQPPEQTRDQIQNALLGDYHARRTAAIDQHLAGLGRRERRHADRAVLAAGCDNEHHLCVCPRRVRSCQAALG